MKNPICVDPNFRAGNLYWNHLIIALSIWLKFIKTFWLFSAPAICLIFFTNAVHASSSTPIGNIDSVRKLNQVWEIKGWTCQPQLNNPIPVRLFLNGQQYGAPQYTNELAEPAIHALCGTSASSGIRYRFTLTYTGAISGQSVRVEAMGTSIFVSLNGSGEFGLPEIDPESIIASANRILLITAHEDDEIWFAPILAKYCSPIKCKVVPSTSNRFYHPDPNEFVNSMAYLPSAYDVGGFSSVLATDTPQTVLNRWNSEAYAVGLINVSNVIHLEIDKFSPDVILTFDPRHGTSCHPDHRALARAVIDGVKTYPRYSFNLSKLLLLQTRRIEVTSSTANYIGAIPAVPKDKHAVVYDMATQIAGRGTGVDMVINLVGKYPTQFPSYVSSQFLSAPILDRTVSLLPYSKYSATDTRYSSGNSIDSRISNCPSPAFQ